MKRKAKRWCVWVAIEEDCAGRPIRYVLAATLEPFHRLLTARARAYEYARWHLIGYPENPVKVLPEGQRPKARRKA